MIFDFRRYAEKLALVSKMIASFELDTGRVSH